MNQACRQGPIEVCQYLMLTEHKNYGTNVHDFSTLLGICIQILLHL